MSEWWSRCASCRVTFSPLGSERLPRALPSDCRYQKDPEFGVSTKSRGVCNGVQALLVLVDEEQSRKEEYA